MPALLRFFPLLATQHYRVYALPPVLPIFFRVFLYGVEVDSPGKTFFFPSSFRAFFLFPSAYLFLSPDTFRKPVVRRTDSL